jgi:hypothetical protein
MLLDCEEAAAGHPVADQALQHQIEHTSARRKELEWAGKALRLYFNPTPSANHQFRRPGPGAAKERDI